MVVTVVLAVVWFNAIDIDNTLVRTDLEKCYLACHAAHNKAITTGKKSIILIDIPGRKYAIDGRWVPLNKAVTFGWVAGAKGPPSSPRTVIQSPCTFTDNIIVFSPNGAISKGSLYFVDKKRRYGYALTISIGHITSIRRYIYRDRWYLLDTE